MICKGPDALKNLNMLLTNDYTVMAEGQARYSPMCNEQGGVVDDLIVYKVRDDCYFIVVNAANKDKDYAWMRDHQSGDVVFEDISSQVAQLALQGPKAIDVLKKVAKEEDIPEKYYTCLLTAWWRHEMHQFQRPVIPGRTEWRFIWLRRMRLRCGNCSWRPERTRA